MKYRVCILVLMILGAALRLDLLIASNWVIDADEAIVGLMAQHIVRGGISEIPVFYYGQHYMGSLEPIMVSFLFWITGQHSSPVLLKLVPLLWSIALIPLGFALGRRVAGERCGLIAAAYIALPPSPLVVWSGMARGGFIEIVVMATVALLLAIRWAETKRPIWLTVSIGLLLGLGWWTNNQIVYAIFPIGLWMLVSIWRNAAWPIRPLFTHLVVGLCAFIVGGLPFWWYNLTHEFVSFEMFSGAKGTKLLPQLQELFTIALPIIFGAKRFWHVADLFPGATVLVWVAAPLILLICAFSSCGGLLRLKSGASLVFIYLTTTCLIFSLSSFGWLTSAPRYLVPIYPALAVMIGLCAETIARLSLSLASAFGACVISFNLLSMYVGGRAVPGQPVVANGERVATSHSELLDWLAERGISMIEANYWIGYRVAFETDEAVKFRVFGDPAMVRIKEYEQEADQTKQSKIPLILVPSQLPSVSAALSELGFTFTSEMVGGYAIITDRVSKLESLQPIAADRFTASASEGNTTVANAFDGDPDTRWGTGTPQRPGMEFTVQFKAPARLRGVLIDWRAFPPDYARGLEIIAHRRMQGGKPEDVVLMSGDQYRRAQPLSTKVIELSLFTEVNAVTEIVFRQLGSDRKFDWSIAEIKFFE